MKRIYVWGGWSRNYGDLAIWDAQSDLLQENSEEILQLIPVNSDDEVGSDGSTAPKIDDALVDAINKSGHMLILGAGGQLMPRSGPYALSGYQVNGRMTTLRRIKVPIVVEGFGLNVFPYGEQMLSKEAVSHFKELCDMAAHVSVRDDLTFRWMHSNNIRVDEIITDPAMFCTPIESEFTPNAPINIGLNWAGDRLDSRYGKRDIEDVICETCYGIAPVVGDLGMVYYFPHVNVYDNNEYHIFKYYLGDRLTHIKDVVPGLYPERLSVLPFFVDTYKKMDVVVGTRWHSAIIPYGQLVPCVTYGATSKNASLRSGTTGITHATIDRKAIETSVTEMLNKHRMLQTDLPAVLDIKLFSLNQHYKKVLSLLA